MQMSAACLELAQNIKGKEALAVQSYARALRQLPTIIAENGGYDSTELVQNLEVELREKKDSGLDMTNGIVGSMEKLCVTVIVCLIQECYRSK
jgi:T-complex protein 1 subunit beta